MNKNLHKSLTNAGAFEYGEVNLRDVEFTEEVRGY
jgi:hypothetical protein